MPEGFGEELVGPSGYRENLAPFHEIDKRDEFEPRQARVKGSPFTIRVSRTTLRR